MRKKQKEVNLNSPEKSNEIPELMLYSVRQTLKAGDTGWTLVHAATDWRNRLNDVRSAQKMERIRQRLIKRMFNIYIP